MKNRANRGSALCARSQIHPLFRAARAQLGPRRSAPARGVPTPRTRLRCGPPGGHFSCLDGGLRAAPAGRSEPDPARPRGEPRAGRRPDPRARHPLRHGEPAGQRASARRVSGRRCCAPRGSRRAWFRTPSGGRHGRARRRVGAGSGPRRRAARSCCSRISTSCPPTASEWAFGPFEGAVGGGNVVGRGALDAKGIAVVHLLALAELARRGTPLERDVILLAVPDEETGGRGGSGWLVREHPELLREAEFVLTEGGAILPGQGSAPGSLGRGVLREEPVLDRARRARAAAATARPPPATARSRRSSRPSSACGAWSRRCA